MTNQITEEEKLHIRQILISAMTEFAVETQSRDVGDDLSDITRKYEKQFQSLITSVKQEERFKTVDQIMDMGQMYLNQSKDQQEFMKKFFDGLNDYYQSLTEEDGKD